MKNSGGLDSTIFSGFASFGWKPSGLIEWFQMAADNKNVLSDLAEYIEAFYYL
jgi:hypothetical protein